ncbi:MAG: hypothetical protein JWO78_1261 [Micavibrio sp.]|nr:hypothetical protein [Micavibrio sp.]
MQDLIFVHGMFQNPKSWENWVSYFSAQGYNCIVHAWAFHEGEPVALRNNPPSGLGELRLETVLNHIESVASQYAHPIMIGHSVGGLIVQILIARGAIAAGVAIDSVAPNAMLDLDWSFLKNSAVITNPLKGNEPVYMDAKTFHNAFANTLTEAEAAQAFGTFATHDSRNILRDCMGHLGHIDLDAPHAPLLLIAGEKDEIIPASLTEKNFKAYKDKGSITTFKQFAGRSHYICGEPGWEDVAGYVAQWLNHHANAGVSIPYGTAPQSVSTNRTTLN